MKEKLIVCDIGGTHVRIAQVLDGAPENIEKYKASDFEELQGALALYCEKTGIDPGGELKIATAGYSDNGVWKFVNQNTWEIDSSDLKAQGWNATTVLNDFEAAAWSLTVLGEDEKLVLKSGKLNAVPNASYCLLGPGTGLGLAYLHISDRPFVQKTHGGHIAAAGITQEQKETIAEIQKTQSTIVVYENLVSGPGILNMKELYGDEKALRLFHEFLGLFAASVTVSGNAYGGLYLTGGVLEHLIRDGTFDTQHFEKWFCLDAVASVKRDLQATPIIYITNPYPALKGVIHA